MNTNRYSISLLTGTLLCGFFTAAAAQVPQQSARMDNAGSFAAGKPVDRLSSAQTGQQEPLVHQPAPAKPPLTIEMLAEAIVQAQGGGPVAAPKDLPRQLSSEPARVGTAMNLVVSKSTVLRLPDPVARLSVGNPAIADATPISEREVYLLGKDLGTTNLIVWTKNNQATVVDLSVTADPSLLQAELRMLLPTENDIVVRSTADSIALLGTVSDAVKAMQAQEIAQAWIRRLTRGLISPVTTSGRGGSVTTVQIGETRTAQQLAQIAAPRVINMLRVRSPMQVMLEVKVAEVSKNLLNRLGVTFTANKQSGSFTYDILSRSNFFNQLLGSAAVVKGTQYAIQLDAQNNNGLIRLLAEPNIMAISGQEASFRAGGKIFIPVGRRNDLTGGTTITLEEKEFGVGLKFKPTVLEGNRINLAVAPEVSELQQTGTPFTTVDGATSVLPSFTLRRAETTVQLNDGQSFMIAGLIQNNTKETINRFPGLGDIPVLGALFRSTEFQTDQTELMFVITPRLVKPLPADYALPTDHVIPPTQAELQLEGRLEGRPREAQGSRVQSGFDVK
ncbi:MAG: type II and III secretion system protein family protein [Rhodospirillaceae bacterium]